MYKLTTQPASEPLDLATAKSHLRILHDNQDTLITGLITAARKQLENDVEELKLLQQTWTLYLDAWPAYSSVRNAHILLRRYPLISVDSVKYYASGETSLSTLDPGDYETDLNSYPGRILLKETPDLNSDKLHAVQVVFKCGWTSAASIPEDILQALKLLITHFYENTQAVVTGTQVNVVPIAYSAIVQNYTKDWLR